MGAHRRFSAQVEGGRRPHRRRRGAAAHRDRDLAARRAGERRPLRRDQGGAGRLLRRRGRRPRPGARAGRRCAPPPTAASRCARSLRHGGLTDGRPPLLALAAGAPHAHWAGVRRPRSRAASATSTWPRSAPRTRSRAAVDRWPVDGVPASPEGWLVTVARRRAVDQLRRRQTPAAGACRCSCSTRPTPPPRASRSWSRSGPTGPGRGRRTWTSSATGCGCCSPAATRRWPGKRSGAHAAAGLRAVHVGDRPGVPVGTRGRPWRPG